jgi:hypothetical protein
VYFAPTAITTRVPSWIVDGLWVAALLFPVGYWGAATGDGRGQPHRGTARGIFVTIGVAVVGPLAVAARLTDGPPPPWTTWCFAAAGLLTGILALRSVREAVRTPAS